MVRFVKGQIICQLTNNLSICQFSRPVNYILYWDRQVSIYCFSFFPVFYSISGKEREYSQLFKGKILIYWTHVDSSLIGERIKANLVPKEASVSLLHFHT